MTVYAATIPVREGQVVSFDGESYTVIERAEMNSDDTFVVEHDGETTERHIDWFADEASKADRIVIEREGAQVPDEELRFTAQEYGELLRWFMCSDPWVTDALGEDRVRDMLNEEARKRGYDGWVEAYHDFHGEGADDV